MLAAEARHMFEARHPLEILDAEGWRMLQDVSVSERIFALPPGRALDLSTGIRLEDGRVVRFRVARDRHFDEVEVVRSATGHVDGATAYCLSCRSYRLLQVTLFSGGQSLRCPFCSSWEMEELVRGKPI
jgi:hypothetical protein